jgi:glycosyltransferase involved in cell wall biosynthesis
MRVCYFGTYRANYSRNLIMMEGLRRDGVEVVECHEQLWLGIEDRVNSISGGWLRPDFWWRVLRTYVRLLHQYINIGEYDVLIVGYPGQFDVYLARVLSWIRHKPLVWDVFMSIYLIAVERGLADKYSSVVWLLRQAEKLACRLPDMLVLDTSEYVAWFESIHGVKPGRFRLVPTGADERIFHPSDAMNKDGRSFLVLYYGTFIPNHSVLTMIETAVLLRENQDIQFLFIGNGPDKPGALDLVQKKGLKNVTFMDWLDRTDLVKHIACADVCLGAFGNTPQSTMTVQNKIYEAIAMAKPVITGDSPSVQSALKHGEQIYLCERSNPSLLAQAIKILQSDTALRRRIGDGGYKEFLKTYTITQLGIRFHRYLEEMI